MRVTFLLYWKKILTEELSFNSFALEISQCSSYSYVLHHILKEIISDWKKILLLDLLVSLKEVSISKKSDPLKIPIQNSFECPVRARLGPKSLGWLYIWLSLF